MKKSVINGSRLAWLLAYICFASYVTRINFGAIIVAVSDSTGFTRDHSCIYADILRARADHQQQNR